MPRHAHRKHRKHRHRTPSPSSSETGSDSATSPQSAMGLTDSLSSGLSSLFASQRGQLALTAVASGVLVGGTILGYQSSQRRIRAQLLKDSIPGTPVEKDGWNHTDLSEFSAHAPTSASPVKPKAKISDDESTALAQKAISLTKSRQTIPEDLILEQLSRNHSFLGPEGLQKVRSSFIIVVGLGGVGSWCTTMLVRSGVSKVRLIDFDQVTLSSLNRHAVATLEDVGTSKVGTMAKHLSQVAPWVEIEPVVDVWREEDAGRLMSGQPDFVVDAIDNIETKVQLLAYCHERSIPVVSSMGAGCKSDPTRIVVGDISETSEDPMSKSTRRKLRARGIATGITAVFSTEKPGPGKASLLPLSEAEYTKGKVEELSVLPDFRARILPVLGTMPATFGLVAANHILCTIAKYPLEYLSPNSRFRPKLYDQALCQLVGLEQRIRGRRVGLKVPLTESDVGYLLEEVFKGRSVISGITTRLHLVRWYPLDHSTTSYEDASTGLEDSDSAYAASSLTEDEPPKMNGSPTPTFRTASSHKPSILDDRGIGLGGAIEMKLTDLVVMTKEEMSVHEKNVLVGGESPESVWGEEVQKRVEKIWREEEEVSGLYR